MSLPFLENIAKYFHVCLAKRFSPLLGVFVVLFCFDLESAYVSQASLKLALLLL
jgi:hypothetical protein